jgi:Flp pilus assembly pilin Flp
MINLYCKIRAFWATRDQGVTAVEYALILVGVVAVVATVIFTFGNQIQKMFTDTNTCLQTAHTADCK